MTARVFRTARGWVLPLAIGVIVGAGGMRSLSAQGPPPMKRTPLIKADLTGVEGKDVYVTLIEAQPGAEFPPHIHYGDEFAYLIEGSIDGFVEQTAVPIMGGGIFHAQRQKVHGGKVTGTTPAKLLAVLIVDKGKPVTEPATK